MTGPIARKSIPLLLTTSGLLASAGSMLSGCGDEEKPLVIPEGCNPLAADWDCLLPFPSDFFRVEDPSLPGGHRISIPAAAKIIRPSTKEPIAILDRNRVDGFSHLPPILAVFPSGVDTSNLVFHTDDLLRTLGDDSPTLLINATTGERVLHFAELDPRADADDRRAFFIRPLVRLQNETRYVIAIRRLRDQNGEAMDPPEGFRRIRDKEGLGSGVLKQLARAYERDLFPVLADNGVSRSELQLAWTFTTETEQNVTADMVDVREQIMTALSTNPPAVTIDTITDDVSEHLFRTIDGTITVPLFVDSANPGAMLNRDPTSGRIIQNGTAQVPFFAAIPRSLADRQPADPKARLIQFGHGFFGSRKGAEDIELLSKALDEMGAVLISVDWWGMSENDRAEVIDAIFNRPAEMLDFTDRVHQGMANALALGYAAQSSFADQPAFQINGDTVFDPSAIYFYGISMGHILGGSFVALSPLVERAGFQVGGAAFTFIMFRSLSFGPFLLCLELEIPDPLDLQKLMALTQPVFDRIDPITYAPHVIADPYPGGPTTRQVLMQIGIDDTSVPNLASHLHGRVIGLHHLQPAPRPLGGFEPATSPFTGSALVEYDFQVDPRPSLLAEPPANSNDVHEAVRQLDAAIEQLDKFFRPDGKIEHTCADICDPD